MEVTNGNGAGTKAPSNLYNMMLRGLQHTDSQGVAQFTTIFPGRYAACAVHIHVLAHLNDNVLSNGKYSGGTNAHVGQLFFDQSLIS
jgi:protocatechuate 3,4-dioxygenase beta subunit